MKTYSTAAELKSMYNAKCQWGYHGAEVFVWETLILNGVDGAAQSFATAQTKALKAFVRAFCDGDMGDDYTYKVVGEFFAQAEVVDAFDAFIAQWHKEDAVRQKEQARRKEFEAKWGFSSYDLVNVQELSIRFPGHKALLNGVVISLQEEADYDWTYYAKSYGHPKKTVTGRFVKFWRKRGNKHDRIEIEKFSTANIIEAVAKYFGVEKATFNKLQTSPYFSIEKRRETKAFTIYTQNFAGEAIGFCVSDGKTTYHANTQKAAVDGWREKVAKAKVAREIKSGVRVTAEVLHDRYGFCYPGIKEFATACDLDYHKSYTIAEIKKALASSPQRRMLMVKYKSEIETMLK